MRKVTVVVVIERDLDLTVQKEGEVTDNRIEAVVLAGEVFPSDAIDAVVSLYNRGAEPDSHWTAVSLMDAFKVCVYTELVR